MILNISKTKRTINKYDVTLNLWSRQLEGFSFNQLLNALLPLKQETDCRAILSKKFCSTINFSNWRPLINNSTNSKQEKIKNPRHIKMISVKNQKQFFSENIIFFSANLCCCKYWKHVVFTLLINLNKSNFGSILGGFFATKISKHKFCQNMFYPIFSLCCYFWQKSTKFIASTCYKLKRLIWATFCSKTPAQDHLN